MRQKSLIITRKRVYCAVYRDAHTHIIARDDSRGKKCIAQLHLLVKRSVLFF